MKIAILYRRPEEAGKEYPLDSQGRGGLKHVVRAQEALQALGHSSCLVDANLDCYEYLRKSDFDLVFNLCDDGFRNDSLLEAHIPAMLDILDISYTGSDFFTLATCVNKARTKEILSFHRIATPAFQVFYRSSDNLRSALTFPLIIKPLHEDASIGLRKESVVTNLRDLKKTIDFVIDNYHQPVLVERFIAGREVYVGILGSQDNLTVLPISEVVFDSSLARTAKICSYNAKWVPETQEYKSTPVECPAKLNKRLERKLITMAKKAYNLLGCSDYGRVDFRIDCASRPFVLEVNPNPDISEDAGLAKMVKACGMDYDGLIERILASALKRKSLARKRPQAGLLVAS